MRDRNFVCILSIAKLFVIMIAACLGLIVVTASARRTIHNAGAARFQDASHVQSGGTLVDISEFIAPIDSAGEARCCCDVDDSWFSTGSRSGRCGLFFLPGRQCNDLGSRQVTWQSGELQHYNHDNGRCMVDREEVSAIVHAVLRRFGSAEAYCPAQSPTAEYRQAIDPTAASVPALRWGERAAVSCGDGWKAEPAEIACEYHSHINGSHSHVPACFKDPEHCAELSVPRGAEPLAAAELGHSRTLTCLQGSRAEHGLLTCGRDGQFHPRPRCARDASYCPAVVGAHGLSVAHAALGNSVQVRCFGSSTPRRRHVRCGGNRSFFPEPSCEPGADRCAALRPSEREARAGAGRIEEEAPYGGAAPVLCEPGMEPVERLAVCGASGGFRPAPRCRAPRPPSRRGAPRLLSDASARAATAEAAGVGRCCCDTDAAGLSGWLARQWDRTVSACRVLALEHCREAEGTHRWIHYTRSADARCMVSAVGLQDLDQIGV